MNSTRPPQLSLPASALGRALTPCTVPHVHLTLSPRENRRAAAVDWFHSSVAISAVAKRLFQTVPHISQGHGIPFQRLHFASGSRNAFGAEIQGEPVCQQLMLPLPILGITTTALDPAVQKPLRFAYL